MSCGNLEPFLGVQSPPFSVVVCRCDFTPTGKPVFHPVPKRPPSCPELFFASRSFRFYPPPRHPPNFFFFFFFWALLPRGTAFSPFPKSFPFTVQNHHEKASPPICIRAVTFFFSLYCRPVVFSFLLVQLFFVPLSLAPASAKFLFRFPLSTPAPEP